jgi:hypothetical protein
VSKWLLYKKETFVEFFLFEKKANLQRLQTKNVRIGPEGYRAQHGNNKKKRNDQRHADADGISCALEQIRRNPSDVVVG